jgi:hypothetical protein
MTTAKYPADYLSEGELRAAAALWGGRLADALVFIIPLSQFVEFDIVGRLFAPDILLLALLPFVLLSKGHVLYQRLPRTFLVMGLVWLLAQVATDLVLATPFEDYARGWAMIAFTLTNFSVLYVLLFRNARRIVMYALGSTIGNLLVYFLHPSAFAVGDPWKFGYGFEITAFLVLLATFPSVRSKSLATGAILAFAAALNIYNGARSLGGACFLVGTYLLMQQIPRARREQRSPMTFAGALFMCTLLALSAVGVLQVYQYCAGNGLLGYAAQQKYEMQSSGRYGVLVGGRGDLLVGLEAALDSPIVGHGSWAKDWRYASQEDAMVKGLGYQTLGGANSWLIPAHSQLVGAWVDAGILGTIFWIWILSLPLRVLMQLYATAEPLAPLIAFLAVILIWDVLFSPYGAERRFLTPYYVIVMMYLLDQSPNPLLPAESGNYFRPE